jgi:hypothetical protein
MPRVTFLALLLASLPVFAADAKNVVFTDPAKAAAEDPDYNVQGEYAGELQGQKRGAQVIARGNGKFHLVAYDGGLPGDGWKKGDRKVEADGALANGAASFNIDLGTLTLKDGVITGTSKDGQKLGELKKVSRQSPTLGAKPPAGAIVLFDGKTNDFKPGKTDGENLATEKTGGQNSQTKFQSVTLHVEFMLPFMPTASGQGRGNSGVYLQGRYECQVLDSFGLEGKNNEAGGIYTISDPKVNMCFPPLTWQTYDIEYTAATFEGGKKTKNATITVKHNGVLVQENTELTKNTTAAPVKEGPEPSHLHLQDHGNPVRFRNVWIVEKK